jgi:DNA invertase Pin-like site-specific DNA recombinase
MISSKTPTRPNPPRSGLPSGRPLSEKIGGRHLERLAMVYVRQSSPQQLVRHQESTQVQYNLKLRAQDLGWPEDRVVVIDDDLGKSGASIQGRLGFQRMVAEVTLDHVGIVLGVEMSRLARSCKDWYQLLEVCAVFGTLIADVDGVYDPAQYNDRLLLGLKGTMSEAELHILQQRMSQGRLNKAKRGELFFSAPIGYVRRPSGEMAFDPDEQAQEVVRRILRRFDDLGTLHAVLQDLVKQGIKLPVRVREGLAKGDLEWHRPNRMTLQNLLKNPLYAGAYAYGRRAVDPRRKISGRPATGRTVVAPEQCKVFLKDRLPAYISWEQYERNQERLKANRAVWDQIGAPKHGPSLLSGLVVCGKCGWRMGVRYSGAANRHVYYCSGRLTNYGEASCQHVAGPVLDRLISQRVLETLGPASLELSLEAAQNIEGQHREQDSLWQKRLERARYEAERAKRQYDHVEPENRLVVRHLEREWEGKLSAQRELDEEHGRFTREQPRVLSQEERDGIRKLAADIPALWNSPHTTCAERKEILRQVIDRVVVDVVGQSERVKLAIHWAGGTQTQHEMVRPVAQLGQLSYWPDLSDRVRELAQQNLHAAKIAQRLNEEGWRPPKRRQTFGTHGVQVLIRRLGLSERRSRSKDCTGLMEHEWWLVTLARELKMPPVTLYLWLRRGWVKARRVPGGRWVLWADGGEVARLRQLREVPRGYHTKRHWMERTGTMSVN